jgi:hypothetical protein
VVPGSARVIQCLEEHRGKLSRACSASLFDHEVKMAGGWVGGRVGCGGVGGWAVWLGGAGAGTGARQVPGRASVRQNLERCCGNDCPPC